MTDLAPAEGNATAEELGVVPPGVDIFADRGGPPSSDADLDDDDADPSDDDGAEAPEADFEPTGPEVYESVDAPASVEADPGVSGNGAGGEEPEIAPPATGGERRRPPLAPEFVDELAGDDASDESDDAPDGSDHEHDEGSSMSTRVGSVPGGSCLWCRADLPERETLNFCPYCGTSAKLVPCPGCGDEVEPEWRFCASCGTEVDT